MTFQDARGQAPDDVASVDEVVADGTGSTSEPIPESSPEVEEATSEALPPVESSEASETSEAREPLAARDGEEASDSTAEVSARLATLAAQVVDLRAMFETKILRSESEAQVNARLHAELQTYRADLYGKLLKPLLQDLVTVREHILRLTEAQQARPPESRGVSLNTFASFADDLGQILEDHGVEIHHSEPGAAYEAGRHQIVSKIDSDDPAAHRTIASVSGDGYSFQGRPLAPQRVTVFAHTANLDGE